MEAMRLRLSIGWGRNVTAWCLAIAGAACQFTDRAIGQEVTLFADDFDAGASASDWTAVSASGDYSTDFAYDYSARGIISAPNSTGGATVGLRVEVNNNDLTPAVDAVSLYPSGQAFDGDYAFRFDMWMNYNGGPGGGSGSTEHATFGIGHDGAAVVWSGNPSSNGRWFAASGEGGATDDYHVWQDGSLLSVAGGGYAAISRNHTDDFYQALFVSPTYETQGAPGKHWVEVEIALRNGVVEWRMNGRLMAIDESPALPSGNVMLGYMDTFSSLASPAADNFVIYDNVRVVSADCDANGVADGPEIAAGSSLDCNGNLVPDLCETIGGGDFDNDGDRDLDDVAALDDCFGGAIAAPAPASPACVTACLDAFDADADTRIDLRDFADFSRRFTTGPIPPRQANAPTGPQLIAEIVGLSRQDRETRIMQEITGGNIPGFLREFVPVNVSEIISGNLVNATLFVTPDYLAVGPDRDFVRMPMSPLIAQPIADAFDCLLPTRKMVDAIYTASAVKLAPSPISPATTDITRVTTFYRHHQTVEVQRLGQPLGLLVGGIKKDVVITPQLAFNPNRVAIYGWHQLNGSPIQPLFLGHVNTYADYSHGIRLVKSAMIVDGAEMSVADVLAHPTLNVLLSDEGVVPNPSY